MPVSVVTDSTSCLTAEEVARHHLGVVALSVTLDDVTYVEGEDDAGFYAAFIQTRSFPTTSQPSVSAFVDAFTERIERGDEVVGVFISSDMSGTHSTALMAREMVLEAHPGATIEIVDSRSNCMELGLAALAAARAAEAGGSAAEAAAAAREMTLHTRFLFVPDTLEYLRRGGRIGNASALIGTLLQIRPILTVVDGRTDVFAKVRTKHRAFIEIADAFERDVAAKGLGEVYVQHIADEPEGRELAELIAAKAGRPVSVLPIGPPIGAHVGPGSVGVVYSTIKPMEKPKASAMKVQA